MYHPDKVAQRIRTEIEDTLHFTPIRRSIEQVDAFEQKLRDEGKYLIGDDGRPASCQNLDPFDIQWMLNERALVTCDAMYGITRYGWVIDEAGVICRFAARVAQEILFGVISDLEAMDVSIEIMILKARQLGMTTLVELLIMLRIVFGYGVNSVIASADREKSLTMAKKLFMAYDMLPLWMKPRCTARVESAQGARMEFGYLNSGVTVQHGNQMSGIARGAAPTIYHLSECASFSNAEQQIEASLLKAVHFSPNVFGILESTGEGDQGWWPNTWRSSKAGLAEGRGRLFPLFLPWFTGIGMWPEPAWLRKHPIPSGFYDNRLPDTKEQVAKCELYTSTHDLIRKHLCVEHPNAPPEMRDWWVDGHMPIAQQWYWEVEHEEAKMKGTESTFLAEMASDDMEALQRGSESVFGREVIAEIDTTRKRTYDVYAFSGQSIEEAFEPSTDDIDYRPGQDGQPPSRVPVRFQSPRGDVYRWELIPLLHDHQRVEGWKKSNPDAFWDYAHSKFFVWHHPRPGVLYSIGIDTAGGDGGDSTVISVTELAPRPQMPDIQAAEFRSCYVSHVEAYAFAMCIAAYYGQYADAPARYPIVGVEVVASAGDVCQLQMRKMGYTHFYSFIRLDSKKIQPAKSNKSGWFTYGWSRPILMGNFIHSAKNGWYELNSPWTLYEMEHFETHRTASGKVKEEHEDGEHDDGIFAAAISIQIARGLQSMTERSKKRYQGDPSADSLPLVSFRPGGEYHRTLDHGSNILTIEDVVL